MITYTSKTTSADTQFTHRFLHHRKRSRAPSPAAVAASATTPPHRACEHGPRGAPRALPRPRGALCLTAAGSCAASAACHPALILHLCGDAHCRDASTAAGASASGDGAARVVQVMRDANGRLRTRQGATSWSADHRSTVSIDEVLGAARCFGGCRGVTASRARTSGSAKARRIMARAPTQEIECWEAVLGAHKHRCGIAARSLQDAARWLGFMRMGVRSCTAPRACA